MLISQSIEDFRRRKRIIKITYIVMYFSLGVIYFPANLILFIYRDQLKKSEDRTMLLVVTYSRAATLSLVTFYMFPTFLVYLKFFIIRKYNAMLDSGGRDSDFSLKQKVIIFWVFFNWLLKLYNAFASILFVTIEMLVSNYSP
jgi:hypothetical protein